MAGVKDKPTRLYCFTQFNYNDEIINEWKSLPVRFIQFGKEICPSTGKPHLQGFVYLHNAKTQSAMLKFIPKHQAHIEKCRGTAADNCVYTGKDGDVFSQGDCPMTQEEKGERGQEWYKAQRIAMRTGDEEAISEYYKCEKPDLIKKHRRDFLSTRVLEDTTEQHLWFTGPSRTGKSRAAREMFPDYYDKDLTKWWDGYTDQFMVLLDDLDRSHGFLLHSLKRMADRYPFPAEYKSLGKIQIRPKVVIVTSNWTIEQLYPHQNDSEPLLERFKVKIFTKQ